MSEVLPAEVQQPPLSLTLVRATMKLLSRTTPDLASKIAETMFMTPRRFKTPQRELEMLASARPLSIAFQESTLQAWTWGQGPAIVLAHGWEGRGSQLTP